MFYSISNTQKGLGGVSFGNFLIKQVVENLKRELPNLKTFVTLSPVPGFAAGWRANERPRHRPASMPHRRQTLAILDQPAWSEDPEKVEEVRAVLLPAAAYYFLKAKNSKGRPVDPVARFHLGNGARLERLNFLGDVSPKGLKQAHGLMVNYLYALDEIETNHEAFAEKGTVAASACGPQGLRTDLPLPRSGAGAMTGPSLHTFVRVRSSTLAIGAIAMNANLFDRLERSIADPSSGHHHPAGETRQLCRSDRAIGPAVPTCWRPEGSSPATASRCRSRSRSRPSSCIWRPSGRARSILPLNTAYTLAELEYFIGDAEPALVVCDPGKRDGIEPARRKGRSLRRDARR